jgi:hypothetical protein
MESTWRLKSSLSSAIGGPSGGCISVGEVPGVGRVGAGWPCGGCPVSSIEVATVGCRPVFAEVIAMRGLRAFAMSPGPSPTAQGCGSAPDGSYLLMRKETGNVTGKRDFCSEILLPATDRVGD